MSRSRRTPRRAESRRTGRRVKELPRDSLGLHRVGGRMSDKDKAKPTKSVMGNLPSTRPTRMARRRDGEPVSGNGEAEAKPRAKTAAKTAKKPTRATPKAVGKPTGKAAPKAKAAATKPKAGATKAASG